jgi:hypothetical protein
MRQQLPRPASRDDGSLCERGAIIDDAVHTVAEPDRSEVDQQTHGELHEAQVRKRLLGVHWSQLLDRFQLHDHQSAYEQIHAKGIFESDPFEFEGYGALLLEGKTRCSSSRARIAS